MKRLLYITTTSYPNHLTNYFQTLVTANELANHYLVTFITQNEIEKAVFENYGIKKNDNLSIKKVCYQSTLQKILFIIRVYIFATLNKFDFVYTRETNLSFYFKFLPTSLVVEVHDIDSSVNMIPAKSRIVAISNGVKRDLIKQFGFDSAKILVAHDGVHTNNFDIAVSKESARRRLDIKGDIVIIYTGLFHPWKGVNVLLEAAKQLKTFTFVVVGGEYKDVQRFRKDYYADNITIMGKKPHREIPFFLKAADILVIPNSACAPISTDYTSPIKLFEYLASKRPIVASDLPSLREVLSEECAVFFQPDSPESLAINLKKLASSKSKMEAIAINGFKKVDQYSWNSRAFKIKQFLR